MKLPILLKIFYIIGYLLVFWVFFLGNIGLLLSIETFKTFLFCLCVFLILFIPIIFIIKGKINKYYLLVVFCLIIFLLPFGFQLNSKKFENFELINLNGEKYNYNILNIIQEKELLNTGLKLAFILGISNEQLKNFKTNLLKYEENIDIDLPSQIPNALINKKEQKYFFYSPKNAKKEKLIIVLNGSCGAFLFYQKYFKQFADKYNTKMASPIFGWGNWYENGGVELIYNTYYDLLKKNEIDKNTQVIIFGISNGGTGLSRIVYFDEKNIFSKIVYISGVMEKRIINSQKFLKNSTEKNFYVIHGKKDDRTLYKSFLDSKNGFKNLDSLIFENGDHFLLLNEEQKIIEKIQQIIEE